MFALKSKKRYPCPVCAFGLKYPVDDDNICPCCGTQFGYDDATHSHKELRAAWLERGANWTSRVNLPPRGFDRFAQLTAALALERPLVSIGRNNASQLVVSGGFVQTKLPNKQRGTFELCPV